VVDTHAPVPGLYVHDVNVRTGGFEPGLRVRVEVDEALRTGAMRHHTGTHLLHAALRDTLGTHVKQAGSLVAPDRLRFDFSHYQGVGPQELSHIQNSVNEQILKNKPVEIRVMGREEALAYGALAFFGDKYGEQVRVVEVPGFSKEFCGGTHVRQTGDLGLFLVTAEQGVSAGTRRLEALTGEAALRRAREDQGILEELEQNAKTDRKTLVDEYARMKEEIKALQRENERLKLKVATAGGGGARGDILDVGDVRVWTPRFDGLDKKAHAGLVDNFRNENRDRAFIVLSSSVDDAGVHVIAASSESLKDRIKAPELMKALGLRGGGRPDFAQGGGVAPGDVDELRRKAVDVVRQMLGR
jgi:alanyl-tRNA synthetase